MSEWVGVHEKTRFVDGSDGTVLVSHPWGVHAVRGLSDETRTALQRLRTAPAALASLADRRDLLAALGKFPFLAVRTLFRDDRPLLRLVPIGADARPQDVTLAATVRLRLSRFAFCRRLDGKLVLESPLSLYRAEILAPELATTVALLATPRTFGELVADLVEDTGEEAVRRVVLELVATGLAETVAEPGVEFADDTDPVLRTWEFHDLLFHTRSRAGRHDYTMGATYRFLGELPPQPAVKPRRTGAVVPLPVPDPAAVAEREPAFAAVAEARRSVRRYGTRGMTVGELGELLHRTLRVRALGPADEENPYERSKRPYASGGAAYDLEVYVAARRCEGLDNGVYHYDPLRHELCQVRGRGPELDELTRRPPGFPEAPDVLLVLTSRFRRLSWKYASIAYALTLRNAGALYQQLYLVATAMGLAPCGLGIGDIALTERALGLPFTEESTVGEFALGSCLVAAAE